jgi:hypothetical protein
MPPLTLKFLFRRLIRKLRISATASAFVLLSLPNSLKSMINDEFSHSSAGIPLFAVANNFRSTIFCISASSTPFAPLCSSSVAKLAGNARPELFRYCFGRFLVATRLKEHMSLFMSKLVMPPRDSWPWDFHAVLQAELEKVGDAVGSSIDDPVARAHGKQLVGLALSGGGSHTLANQSYPVAVRSCFATVLVAPAKRTAVQSSNERNKKKCQKKKLNVSKSGISQSR